MKYYEEERVKTAIEAARVEINDKAKSTNRYIRGYNDCFAFLLSYERHLRGELSVTNEFTLSYNDSKEFMNSIKSKLGYKDLNQFAEAMNFEPVVDRKPLTGDIAFFDDQGFGSAMIAEGGYWVSTTENNRGVRPYFRLSFKEIKLGLLARPLYIGE
jgi:hypothetical protein